MLTTTVPRFGFKRALPRDIPALNAAGKEFVSLNATLWDKYDTSVLVATNPVEVAILRQIRELGDFLGANLNNRTAKPNAHNGIFHRMQLMGVPMQKLADLEQAARDFEQQIIGAILSKTGVEKD